MKRNDVRFRVPGIQALILTLVIVLVGVIMGLFFVAISFLHPEQFDFLGLPGKYLATVFAIVLIGAGARVVYVNFRDYMVVTADSIIIMQSGKRKVISWCDIDYVTYKTTLTYRHILIGSKNETKPILIPYNKDIDEMICRNVRVIGD